jgi:hypothetical protein
MLYNPAAMTFRFGRETQQFSCTRDPKGAGPFAVKLHNFRDSNRLFAVTSGRRDVDTLVSGGGGLLEEEEDD